VKTFRDRSLRQKLSLASVSATAIALLVTLLFILVIEFNAGRRDLTENLTVTTEMLARNTRSALVFDDPAFAATILQNLSVQDEIRSAVIVRTDGRVFARYISRSQAASAPDPATNDRDGRLISVTRPIEIEGEQLGMVTITADMSDYYERIGLFALTALLVVLASLGAAFLLWSRFLRSIARPFNSLVGVVRRVTDEHDYSLRAERHGHDELGQLIDGFNRMLVQIQQRDRELESSRQDLEDKVRQRTRMLEAAKEAAESADRAKGSFIANVSHEVRTPLNAVLGLTELALKAKPTPTQRDYLAKILNAGQSLHEIISDILDLSRIEAGGLELEHLDFNLQEVRSRVLDILALKAHEKGLALDFTIADDVPLDLHGDPLRLSQVLLNLVGNAIKFTEHGRIEVRVTCPSASSTQVTLDFSVRDTGIGIEEDRLAHIFEPFAQADDSHTRLYGGTGLGLSISNWLVRMMHGEFNVDSTPGKGSIFHFTARLARATAVDTAPANGRDPVTTAGTRRVLLVEDNPINRQIVIETLHDYGYRVSIAENGQQALDAVAAQTFDAVLMDIQMPVMDGFEATRRIRDGQVQPGLPIIAMTAHAREDMRKACNQAGIDEIIAKPVDSGTLIRVLLEQTGDAATPAQPILDTAVSPPTGSGLPAELPGIDIDAGLRRVNGKQAVLRRLLVEFRRSHAGSAAEILEAHANGDTPRAKGLLHRLRGVAVNLGAMDLAAAAGDLESALRDSREVADAATRFTGHFDAVMQGLHDHLAMETVAETPGGAFDPARLQVQLDALQALLDSGSFKAPEVLAALPPLLGGRCAAAYQQLVRCVDEYRYDEARSAATALAECIAHERDQQP